MIDLKSKFGRTYVDLPISVRENIAVVVDDISISWNVLKIEIDNDTEIGKKGLKILNDLGFLKK
ncbi:MAG: hypothetical protein PHO75_04615 [Candidatus Shapirobacteria bacterium]|jgi:hypothetical protein|nr:hypothetical protein [Candidatus Shapirobacteria bacterium]